MNIDHNNTNVWQDRNTTHQPMLEEHPVPSPGLHDLPRHHPHHEHPRNHPFLHGNVTIDYETGYERIEELFGESASACIGVIERSPLEVKVTHCLALGLDVDFSSLPHLDGRTVVKHPSPFLDAESLEILASSLPGEHSVDDLLQVYGDAPDEQIALAVAVARLASKVKELACSESSKAD